MAKKIIPKRPGLTITKKGNKKSAGTLSESSMIHHGRMNRPEVFSSGKKTWKNKFNAFKKRLTNYGKEN